MKTLIAIPCCLPLVLYGCTARQPAAEAPRDGGETTERAAEVRRDAPDDEGRQLLRAAARAEERGMACTEATRVARGALVRMGYTIASVQAAKAGAVGKIVGHKNSGWSAATPEAGEQHTATVEITCSNWGAEFEASTEGSFMSRLSFRREFPEAIAKVASRRLVRPRIQKAPERGLSIRVEPLRGRDAAAEFGTDLTALGLTPVRVRIANRTNRTYAFRAAKLQLITQEGARTSAVPLADVTRTLGNQLDAVVRKKLIVDRDIEPDATVSGFLYFPASAYRRAKLVMVDRESEEAEGFSVEF